MLYLYLHTYIILLSVNLVCMWLHTPLCLQHVYNYSCPWVYDHPIPINTWCWSIMGDVATTKCEPLNAPPTGDSGCTRWSLIHWSAEVVQLECVLVAPVSMNQMWSDILQFVDWCVFSHSSYGSFRCVSVFLGGDGKGREYTIHNTPSPRVHCVWKALWVWTFAGGNRQINLSWLVQICSKCQAAVVQTLHFEVW